MDSKIEAQLVNHELDFVGPTWSLMKVEHQPGCGEWQRALGGEEARRKVYWDRRNMQYSSSGSWTKQELERLLGGYKELQPKLKNNNPLIKMLSL